MNSNNPEEQSELSASPPASPPLDIVALDDDADFREFIASILEPSGHELRTAATPHEFFRACDDRIPDVVLLDMNMGEIDGATVIDQIRQRWPRLCVIVITGYPSLDSMRKTFKKQVFDYIAKPFSTHDLNHALAQAAVEFGLGQRPQDRLRATLGRQIRLARTERGWTLKELSEVSSVSVSQLSSIERGAHLPSIESLLSIAQAIGKTPSQWLAAAGF